MERTGECTVQVQVTRRELLCSPRVRFAWAWDRRGIFSKEPINFPNFLHSGWVHPFVRSLWSSTFSRAPQQSGTRREREECLSPWRSNPVISWGVKLSLPGWQAGFLFPSLLSSMSSFFRSSFLTKYQL